VQVKTRVKIAWLLRLKLRHDDLLSCSAFDFNLHPYILGNLLLYIFFASAGAAGGPISSVRTGASAS
jgi:hypothetical protein